MTVTKDTVVEINYKLTNDAGEVLDTSEGGAPLAYLHGHKNIVPGLEKELEGKTEGDAFKASVDPTEGYGPRINELVTEVPKEELANLPDLDVGMQIQGQTEEGVQVFTVLKMDDKNITLDGNHPLAGETLHFEIQVLTVRKASDDELAHGHAHGAHGHQH